MPSLVTPVALDLLTSWPTRRLLGLRDRLLCCEASLEQSDVQDASEIDPTISRFKDDLRWASLYDATLGILRTREHIPGGDARKLARQTRAQRRTGRGSGRQG